MGAKASFALRASKGVVCSLRLVGRLTPNAGVRRSEFERLALRGDQTTNLLAVIGGEPVGGEGGGWPFASMLYSSGRKSVF